jgi:hypothetical protein
MHNKVIKVQKYVEEHGTISIVPDLDVLIEVIKTTRWSKSDCLSVKFGKWGDFSVRYTDSGVLTISAG